MGTTWHARPRGRATRARATPTWRISHTYLFILYNNKRYSASRISGGYSTLKIVRSYKPDDSLFYFRVGLIHTALTQCFIFRRCGSRRTAGSGGAQKIHTSITRTRTTRSNQARAGNPRVITVGFHATWRHHTHRSRGRADHQALIKHVLKRKHYNGHDFTRSNASGALHRDPTGAVSCVL